MQAASHLRSSDQGQYAVCRDQDARTASYVMLHRPGQLFIRQHSRFVGRSAMTRFLNHCSFPYVSSTLVATFISLAATVLVVPVIATTQLSIEQSSALPHGQPYRLSPIPAGADWTS
jgi:hypothetical protein